MKSRFRIRKLVETLTGNDLQRWLKSQVKPGTRTQTGTPELQRKWDQNFQDRGGHLMWSWRNGYEDETGKYYMDLFMDHEGQVFGIISSGRDKDTFGPVDTEKAKEIITFADPAEEENSSFKWSDFNSYELARDAAG